MSGAREVHGPVEDATWPSQITGRVVEPGASPRIHGLDVEGDLARHYGFGEVVLTALSGVAPSRAAGRAFEAALVFAAPVNIGEAPAHAASLARMCGAKTSGVLGVGCLALAEQARASLDAHASLLGWLASPSGPLPDDARAKDDDARAAVARLRAAIGAFAAPGLEQDPSLVAAILCVLHACGARAREQMESALLIARVACVAAEAFATPLADFRNYPMDLPRYRYVGEARDE